MKYIKKIAPPFLVAVFVGAVYYRTLAPGLTWAYDGADGGDLLTAIATGGVPHPGGYPTYILFASVFVKLPFGSLAFCMNVFSSICMILAVVALYKLTLSLTEDRFVASITALGFGTFQLVWSQALITEVYALQALLSLLVLLFFVSKNSVPFRNFTGGLAMGLALGNHLTAIFLLPFMFFDNSENMIAKPVSSTLKIKGYVRILLKRLLGLCVGLSVFVTIPLRARTQAPVNWGNAIDWNGFWWLVSGAMYRGRLSNFSPEYLFTALRAWSGFLLNQLGFIGLLIGLLVLIVFFKPTSLYLMTGWLFLSYSVFAILYYSPDSYVYLIPVLMAFAIWIGLGIGSVIEKLPPNPVWLKPILMSISIAIIGLQAIQMIPKMDMSNDHTAEQYAQTVLENLPMNAIVMTKGDEALFALWYFHYVKGQRPDVAVVSNELLVQPWYHYVLKSTYPTLNIPNDPEPQGIADINAEHPLCLLSTDLRPQFDCLP